LATMNLTIVIPTLNEAGNIGVLLDQLHVVNPNVEILVCDNGSTDGTPDIATKKGATVCPGTGLVGDAVLRGLQAASRKNVIVMDADFSHSPNAIPAMVDALKEHDFVVASRYTKSSQSEDTLKNRIISHIGNLIALTLAPSMTDRMSGFWGARREVLETGFQNGVRPTAKSMLEFYVKGKPSSYAEVGFTFNPRVNGTSKIGRSWSLWRSTTDVLKLNLHQYASIVKFLTVSGIGIGVNLGTLLILTEVVGLWYFLSATLAVGAAVTWNFTMHSMWTFGKCKSLFDFWNLGHNVDDDDFEWWEYLGPHPVKRWWKRRVAQITHDLVAKYPLEKSRILILGCGSSPSINLYHCQRVGVDISKAKIDFLQNHTEATLLLRDVTKPLNLPPQVPGTYDIIICNEVIEHLSSQGLQGVVDNIRKLVSHDGKVIVSIPDESSSLVGKWAERIMHNDIHTPVTMTMVAEAMAAIGFKETGRDNHLWVQIARFERQSSG